MDFTHDTDVALVSMASLVNTRVGDTLTTLEDLDAFVAAEEITGSRAHDQAELDGVLKVRARLAGFWELDEDGAVALVNQILSQGRALPQLVRHDHWDWHLHATPGEAPLATRIAVEGAMAMIDVIRSKGMDRMRHCSAEDCTGVFIDLSRNRSKRYCDLGCGNRVNVAAYRARRRGA